MTSDSLAEELDFEDDTQNEPQDDEFYCSICSDCYDEAREFIEHVNSSEHLSQCNEKLSSLQGGDKYCSICLTKAEPTFEAHCSSSDHCQFFNSLHRSMPETPSPLLRIVEVNLQPKTSEGQSQRVKKASKTTPLRKKDIANKMIGLNHIKRKDDEWFCNICLEKFMSVEAHCSKAMHAIQCIKICDPDLAYEIKVSANQKGKKKIVSSIISSKVEEIYEKEKDTPEYIKTMLELEGVHPTDIPVKEEELVQQSSPPVVVSNEEISKNETVPEIVKEDPVEQTDDATPSNSQDIGEMVCLFEEEDRSFIPMNDDISDSNSTLQDSAKSGVNRVPSRNMTMIVGISHLKLKGRTYYCGLCDIMCKTSLESCKLHITSSLHRRRMINKFSAHPIPNYLEKLRTKDAVLYNKLIRIETMKIELEERRNETLDDQRTRAGILGIKKVDMLPEPLMNVNEVHSSEESSLNLMELAKKWDSEKNANIFQKSAKEAPFTGSNKSTISPIQPQIENILVGVKTVTHLQSSSFHCGLCNIKFDVKNKRNDKHHVNGRLHKKKALVAAYGPDVESYLQYRSRKDGYDALNRIINQACVPLEKEEVESEPPASREIRAKLLGVKVEQLPLPMIIMFDNTEAFDIKMAINEWKGGKKNSGIFPKAVIPTDVSKETSSFKKSSDDEVLKDSESEKQVEPSPTLAEAPDTDLLKKHIDSQSFDQKEVPLQTTTEPGKSPGARNIFDLCKPMPDASPEKPVFKTSASATMIKNIDIDGLRKSLVDAELGEFVPVAKAIPEKETPPENKQKETPKSEDTSKSSISEEERKRRKSAETVSIDKKKKLAESIKANLGQSKDDQKSLNPSNEKQGKNDNCARRTYDGVIRTNNVHQNSKSPMNKVSPHEQQSNNVSSDHRNPSRNQSEIPSSSRPNQSSIPCSSRPNQQSNTWNGPSGKIDYRNQPRGVHSKNQFSRNERDNGRNQPRGGHNKSQVSRNERENSAGSGSRNNSADRNNNNFNSSNNFTSDRGNNSRSQGQSGGVQNTNYPSRGNSGNRGNSRGMYPQPPAHGNQSSQSGRFAKTFDIDVGSMKNTNLSSALAKVTNIAPISQACSAKINEAAQNIRSNNQVNNYMNNGFPNNPTQSGTNLAQQNYHGGDHQFHSGRQGNNHGFEGSYSHNSGNQGGFHNQAGGFGNNNGGNGNQPNNWSNNYSNQYGSGQGGNHGHTGGHTHGGGLGSNNAGERQFNQSNVGNNYDRRNNFQNNNSSGRSNFGNNRGGFNNTSGKRSNNSMPNSFGYDDRQKRQRNDHFNR